MFRKQFNKLQNACAFAEAIVNTVREPLVVLDQDLRVVAASRSFYRTFQVNPKDTEGKLLYELGDSVWDIPKASVAAGENLAGGRRDRSRCDRGL
jgi:PAS domain-containing protein